MNIIALVDKAISDIGTEQIPDEITRFAQLAHDSGCKNILEIGSAHGGTFYVLCSLFPEEGKKVSVDKGGINPRNKDEKVEDWARHIYIVKGKSYHEDTIKSVEGVMAGDKLDLLFIDGNHHYGAVKKDYNSYRKFVRDGGLIGFHDIKDNKDRKKAVQVPVFWKELLVENNFKEVMTFENRSEPWGGIGVVRV
jgi:cephalosporin hydroxylase